MANLRTVKDLIEWLSTQPPDAPVVLSSDGEGNTKSCLADGSVSMIAADDVGKWDIETYAPQEEVDDPESAFDPEWDSPPEGEVLAVVLWPVN
jgi:hypothetical protein